MQRDRTVMNLEICIMLDVANLRRSTRQRRVSVNLEDYTNSSGSDEDLMIYNGARIVSRAHELRDAVYGMLSQMDPALVAFCDKIAAEGGPSRMPDGYGRSALTQTPVVQTLSLLGSVGVGMNEWTYPGCHKGNIYGNLRGAACSRFFSTRSTTWLSTVRGSSVSTGMEEYGDLFFDLFKKSMTKEVDVWVPKELRASPSSKGPIFVYVDACFGNPTKVHLGATGIYRDGTVLFAKYCEVDLDIFYPEQGIPPIFKVSRDKFDAVTAELLGLCNGTFLAVQYDLRDCEFVTDSNACYSMLCENEKNNFTKWCHRLLGISIKSIWLKKGFKVLYHVKGNMNEVADCLSNFDKHMYGSKIEWLLRLESQNFAGKMARLMKIGASVGKVGPGQQLNEWVEECITFVVCIAEYLSKIRSLEAEEKKCFDEIVQWFVTSRRGAAPLLGGWLIW